ncbi:hypothetical protein MATL_G00228160 [Megalops atlanticus]|uniref:Apolipoprotein M n=1 Tax=Megalops atlanticus TaxID=7932 RepID=A0A9D3PD75_MEGAT|nr:hypothetical protein MATL_G00228160 [Megalops atlanticus]
MFVEVSSFVTYVYWLFQSLFPCTPPQLLPTSHLNTQQYLGTWYFVAAVGGRQSDIGAFTPMDSTVFDLQEAKKTSTLRLTGAIRVGDVCVTRVWTYHLHPEKDYLEVEGRPNRRTVLWSGQWLSCSDCILLQETDRGEVQDEMNRVMLYARNGSLSTDIVKDFQAKMSCLGIKEFLSLPQKREYCPMDGAPAV